MAQKVADRRADGGMLALSAAVSCLTLAGTKVKGAAEKGQKRKKKNAEAAAEWERKQESEKKADAEALAAKQKKADARAIKANKREVEKKKRAAKQRQEAAKKRKTEDDDVDSVDSQAETMVLGQDEGSLDTEESVSEVAELASEAEIDSDEEINRQQRLGGDSVKSDKKAKKKKNTPKASASKKKNKQATDEKPKKEVMTSFLAKEWIQFKNEQLAAMKEAGSTLSYMDKLKEISRRPAGRGLCFDLVLGMGFVMGFGAQLTKKIRRVRPCTFCMNIATDQPQLVLPR